jgi:hypothetical protein
LDELVEKSDIITINTPLTPETDGMFNRDLLFRMKKGASTLLGARLLILAHLLKSWRKVIWQDMLEMYGILSLHLWIIHGEVCLTTGWYITTPGQL